MLASWQASPSLQRRSHGAAAGDGAAPSPQPARTGRGKVLLANWQVSPSLRWRWSRARVAATPRWTQEGLACHLASIACAASCGPGEPICRPSARRAAPSSQPPHAGCERVLLATWHVSPSPPCSSIRALVAATPLQPRGRLACQLASIALVALPPEPRVAAMAHRTREGLACQLASIAFALRLLDRRPRRGHGAAAAGGFCLPIGKYRIRCAASGAARVAATTHRTREGLACQLASIAFVALTLAPRARRARRGHGAPDAGRSCLPVGKHRLRCAGAGAAPSSRQQRPGLEKVLLANWQASRSRAGERFETARKGRREPAASRAPPSRRSCRRIPGNSRAPSGASLLDATGRPAHNARRERRNRISGREP
jgi:hypothetical protein